MSKVILRTPLLSASGKTFGMKSHYSLCTRKATGVVYTYHWPENYLYPIIPKRQQAAHRLGKASLLYNLVAANSTLLRQFQKDYEAHERKHRRKPLKVKHYTNLRYYIIAYYTDQMKNHQQSYDRLAASITGSPVKEYVTTPTNGKSEDEIIENLVVSEKNCTFAKTGIQDTQKTLDQSFALSNNGASLVSCITEDVVLHPEVNSVSVLSS